MQAEHLVQKTHLCLGRQKCVFCWLGNRDSNPNKQSQSLSCYPYTIPQYLILPRLGLEYYTTSFGRCQRRSQNVQRFERIIFGPQSFSKNTAKSLAEICLLWSGKPDKKIPCLLLFYNKVAFYLIFRSFLSKPLDKQREMCYNFIHIGRGASRHQYFVRKNACPQRGKRKGQVPKTIPGTGSVWQWEIRFPLLSQQCGALSENRITRCGISAAAYFRDGLPQFAQTVILFYEKEFSL